MLKTINPLLTGDLLAILSDMGHGDEVVITDANFPASAVAQRLIRLPVSATDTLDAVLSVLPLDDFVDTPAAAMDAPDGRPAIYDDFEALMTAAEGGREIRLELVDRFAFYDRAQDAYAVIATGERRLYANIILKKGVLRT